MRGVHLLVKNDHDLFPRITHNAIKTTIEGLCDAVEKTFGISPSRATLNIESQSLDASKYLHRLYSSNPQEAAWVRLIVTDGPEPDPVIPRLFPSNLLLVLSVEREENQQITSINGSNQKCKIFVAPADSQRLIEDIALELFLAQHFRSHPIIKSVLAKEGQSSLYRKKAQFFRRRKFRSWLSNIDKSAEYAPLSLLNKHPSIELEERAVSAFNTWTEFVDSLSAEATALVKTTIDIAIGTGEPSTNKAPPDQALTQELTKALKKLKKVGGQLPVQRVASQIASYQSAETLVLILRKSSRVRKSPKMRNMVQSIFGPRAKVNSFRIFPMGEYDPSLSTIHSLIQAEVCTAIKVTIKENVEVETYGADDQGGG